MTRRRFAGLLGLCLLLLSATSLNAQTKDEFFFKSGDRVLFLGDSITE